MASCFRDVMHRKRVLHYCLVLTVIMLLINFLNYSSVEPINNLYSSNITPDEESVQKFPITTTTSLPIILYKSDNISTCDLTTDSPNPLHNIASIVEDFFKCASMILLRFSMNPQGMLFNWPYTIYVCDEEDSISKIPLRSLDNGQNQYWVLLPTCNEKTVLVKLGTSENTKSEEELKGLIKDFEFFESGMYPFSERNETYSQVALSTDENKLPTANISSDQDYENKTQISINVRDFKKYFSEIVGVKKIDMLWITRNAKNFEYDRFININGEFENMGIVVCQINIEITKNDAKKWSRLINPLIHQKRFIFMRPMTIEDGEFTRTYLLNVSDLECVRKYLQ